MAETAQIILAGGVAAFLVMLNVVGIIWAIRCKPGSPQYRFPLALGMSTPMVAGIIYVILHWF